MQQTAVPLRRWSSARVHRRERLNPGSSRSRSPDPLEERELLPMPLPLVRALASVGEEQRSRATNVLKDLIKKAGERKASLLRKLGN